MIIRKVLLSDIDELIDLCINHAKYEKTYFDIKNKKGSLIKHLFSEANDLQCLVVENNQKLMGYSVFMKQFSTWDASFYVYMDCLYLEEAIRGLGVGKEFMKKIREYAIDNGCKEIQWQTPYFNKQAINFYNKLGAQSKTKERFFWKV